MSKSIRQTVLIIDDEQDIRELLVDALSQVGFDAVAVASGEQMWAILEQRDIHLVILDLRLHGEDGLTLARELRQQNKNIAIMMLTGKGDATDRILGLEVGADDYLMKPFDIRELQARAKALLRRSSITLSQITELNSEQQILRFGDWELNLTQRQLHHRSGRQVELTLGEFSILETLAQAPDRIMTREQILAASHGLDADVYDRTVDVLILRLRRKIESNPRHPSFICTERGLGYRFHGPVLRIDGQPA